MVTGLGALTGNQAVQEVDACLEITEICDRTLKVQGPALLFENVKESEFRVIGNLFCNKAQFADYFGIGVAEIIPTLTKAIAMPSPQHGFTAPPLPVGEG